MRQLFRTAAFWHGLTLPKARHSLMASRLAQASRPPARTRQAGSCTWPQEEGRGSPTVARRVHFAELNPDAHQ